MSLTVHKPPVESRFMADYPTDGGCETLCRQMINRIVVNENIGSFTRSFTSSFTSRMQNWKDCHWKANKLKQLWQNSDDQLVVSLLLFKAKVQVLTRVPLHDLVQRHLIREIQQYDCRWVWIWPQCIWICACICSKKFNNMIKDDS